MRELRRIDVLLNEDTGERFDKGDIVKITTNGTYSRVHIGRIDCIDTLQLTLDMSKDYQSYTNKFKYDEILRIDKVVEFVNEK